MSLPDESLRAAVLKTLADDIETAIKGGKTGLKEVMTGLGIKSLTARLPDGREVATLTLAGGNETPKITDEGRFLAWVQKAHPTETEVIVRPDYAKNLLEQMAKAGRPVDPRTGETVPGVEFEATTAYVAVSFAKGDIDGREHVRRAHRDGVITLPDLLALPAAPEGAGQ